MAVCLTPQLSDLLKYNRRLFNDAYSTVEFTYVTCQQTLWSCNKGGWAGQNAYLHGGANKCMQNLDRNIWKEEATWDILMYV